MSKQHKRASVPENGEPGRSGKKPRVAQEGFSSGEEEGEVSQGSEGEEAVVVVVAMEEPQVNLMVGLSRVHCRACLRPLNPPTFKCRARHIVCGTCRVSHAQACTQADTYAACPEVDDIVRDAKLRCPFTEFGCTSCPVYYQAAGHELACQWAPCYCPLLGCDAYNSPARLLDHFRTCHSWQVTDVGYGKPLELAMPPPQGLHVVVGKEDGCVFLVSSSTLGVAIATSLVCVRANGDAAAGVPQFKCTLWVEARCNSWNGARITFTVASRNLSGGFVAAEQGMFLAVPPKLLHDASGEAPVLRLRIDKVGAAAANSTNPPARSSGRRNSD